MGIMYNKGQNYSILSDTFKIGPTILANLKALGISLKVGDTAISLDNGKGLAKTHSFNTLASNVVKNPQAKDIVEVNAFVSNFLSLANQVDAQAVPAEPKKATKAASIDQSDVDKMPVVKLRDAVAMYQRVHGTSGGSIYRVVAFNDKIKVAARIKGTSVSVRIEGVFDSDTVKAFSLQGLTKHSDEYMSGHFNCEKCTAQKLIGAILVGAGIPFSSPLPNISAKVFG